MQEYFDRNVAVLRFFIAGFIFIISLVLLSYILSSASVIGNTTFAHAGNSKTSDSSTTLQPYSSPNVVTNGLTNMAKDFGNALDVSSQFVADTSRAATRAAVSSATFVARTAWSSVTFVGSTSRSVITFAGRSVASTARFVFVNASKGLGFAFSLPSRILGSFSDARIVNAVIKPDDNTSFPVIEPSMYAGNSVMASFMPLTTEGNEAKAHASWPLHGRVTTRFGVPHRPYQITHTGIDISSGSYSGVTAIKPFKPGKVINVVYSRSGLGNYVVVEHGEGLTSLYAHLSSIAVEEQQEVTSITTLGMEGSTGASTGTHLHFEVRINDIPVNPYDYIDGHPQ